MGERAVLHVIVVTGTGAVTLDQLSEWSGRHGVERFVESADAQAYPRYSTNARVNPEFTATTSKISRLLTSLGLGGLALGGDGAGCTLYMAKRQNLGTIASGSVHSSLAFSSGMLLPTRLVATQAPPATMEFVMLPTSAAGGTHPLTYSKVAALPTTDPADFEEAFVCGPVKINGVTIAEMQSLTVDFNWTYEFGFGDGLPYPTALHLKSCAPTIQFTTVDRLAMDTLGTGGTVQTATDSVFYLRKCTEGLAARVADGTAQHISLTIDEGQYDQDSWSLSGHDDAEFVFTCTPTYDLTALPIAINAATAIT